MDTARGLSTAATGRNRPGRPHRCPGLQGRPPSVGHRRQPALRVSCRSPLADPGPGGWQPRSKDSHKAWYSHFSGGDSGQKLGATEGPFSRKCVSVTPQVCPEAPHPALREMSRTNAEMCGGERQTNSHLFRQLTVPALKTNPRTLNQSSMETELF